MNTNYANKSIKCSVDNCVNHCSNDDYCALKEITVTANCKDPKDCKGTDCGSFAEKPCG